MRPILIIAAAAVVAALVVAGLLYSLPEAKQADGRLELAKILLQGGVLGALAIIGRWFLADWETSKEQAIRRQEQFKIQKEHLTRFLRALRGRFRVALQRTEEKDRVEFPEVWQVLLREGVGNDDYEEDSVDLVAGIKILLVELGFPELLADLDKLNEILGELTKPVESERPIGELAWTEIITQLNRGHKLVDGLFWTAALGKATPATK